MRPKILYPNSSILLKNLGVKKILIILLILLYSSIRFTYIKFFLIRFRFSSAFSTISKIKLFKYYITSGVIGFISAEAIKSNANFFTKLRYSFLTMDWGLLILVIDAVSDVEKSSEEYSEEVNIVCYKIITEQFYNSIYKSAIEENIEKILQSSLTQINEFNPQTPLSHLSLFLANRINKKMRWVMPKTNTHLDITLKAIKECAILCKGQIDSFKQKNCDSNYNLNWYCEKVIYNKTIYIYAFIYFFAQTNEEGENAINLGDALLLANDLYLNRQLLDDMNDIVIDTEDGIFAGPSYLLCSDFEKYENGGNDFCNFLKSQTLNRITVISNIKYFSTLFRDNILQNPNISVAALNKSNIPNIILDIIEDKNRYLPAHEKLIDFLSAYPRTLPLTTLFFYRCAKSLEKAHIIANKISVS